MLSYKRHLIFSFFREIYSPYAHLSATLFKNCKGRFTTFVFKNLFQVPICCQVTICFCADSVKFPWHCFTSIHFKKRRENYSPPSKQNPYRRAISHRSWNLRMLPKSYLRFHWDCKQPLGWTEEQYVKMWNLFPTFLWNYTYNFENWHHCLTQCR